MKVNLKIPLKNVIFLLILLKICIVFGQNSIYKKRIVIDPGHGGIDSGAIGINGIQEKDVVLKIAKEIIRLNNSILDSKFDIYLTRYRDTFVSLYDRTILTKKLKADAFVSLHCNASQNFSRGIEVFVHNADNSNKRESISLGITISNENTQKLGFEKRDIKFANFQVLRETISFCPAILVEIGFVTNKDEANYFLKPSNIKALALAVLMGINKYLNTEL